MHNAWGSYPIFFRTLILWSLSSVCWWKASRFFLVLCAIMKLCREVGLFGTILSLGSSISFHFVCFIGYLISWCIFYLVSFKWLFLHLVSYFHLIFLFNWYLIKSCVVLVRCQLVSLLMCCWVLESTMCWFLFVLNHELSWVFDIIWTTLCRVNLSVAVLVYLVFCPNCISIWFLKVLSMHIYLMYFLWHAFFLWPNI